MRKVIDKLLEKYCPVSLFPICANVFEHLIYNRLFEFFTGNYLISSNQSGFKPGNSCLNQLFSIKLIKISQNSQKNTCARVSFLTKFQASDLRLY